MPGQSSVTNIKSKWINGILTFYDSATNETVLPVAPMYFYEDFLGEGGIELGNTVDRWEIVDVGGATEALRTDVATGVWRLHMHATSEAEDAVLYWGDQTSIDVLNDVVFETRINMAILPTAVNSVDVVAVFGMCGDHNLDKDTTAEAAWFRLNAAGLINVETDDGTINTALTSTGVTAVAGTYNIFRIDFADLSDVKFYIDGARVAGATTFDLSALTTTTGLMQPYFSLDKASDLGVGDMDIDYVRIWGTRSSRVDNT